MTFPRFHRPGRMPRLAEAGGLSAQDEEGVATLDEGVAVLLEGVVPLRVPQTMSVAPDGVAARVDGVPVRLEGVAPHLEEGVAAPPLLLLLCEGVPATFPRRCSRSSLSVPDRPKAGKEVGRPGLRAGPSVGVEQSWPPPPPPQAGRESFGWR